MVFKSSESGDMLIDKSQLITSVVNLNTYQIQPEALQLIPEVMARKYNVIPLSISNNSLLVGMTETDDVLALEALTAQARLRIEPLLSPADEIQRAIDRNYKAYGEIEEQFSQTTPPVSPTEERISVKDV